MKTLFAAAALAARLAGPALAQSAAETITKAATEAATQAAVDKVQKAAGGDKHKAKDKSGPNYGKSEEHRQDGEHGHKGKKKGKE